MRHGRRGTTLLEVMVALGCGLLVVQLALHGLVAARTVERDLRTRTDRLDVSRVTRSVLRAELRAGVPGRDWVAFPPDSVRLRGFRGRALVCPEAVAPGPLLVSFDGDRRPDPAKDSVLLLDLGGRWWVAGLLSVRPPTSACPLAPLVAVEAWEVDPTPPTAVVLARLFEPLSYHLVDGALRVRSGGGGRQPITPDILDTRVGGFGAGESLGLVVRDAEGWTWDGYLAGPP